MRSVTYPVTVAAKQATPSLALPRYICPAPGKKRLMSAAMPGSGVISGASSWRVYLVSRLAVAGRPHCGHKKAASEIRLLQSGHVVSDMEETRIGGKRRSEWLHGLPIHGKTHASMISLIPQRVSGSRHANALAGCTRACNLPCIQFDAARSSGSLCPRWL